MVTHLVLIKLKQGVTRSDPRVPAWKAQFEALEHQCQGIVRFECGINMAFATRADLDAYGPHPAHQDVVAKLREIADWIICDYEVAA